MPGGRRPRATLNSVVVAEPRSSSSPMIRARVRRSAATGGVPADWIRSAFFTTQTLLNSSPIGNPQILNVADSGGCRCRRPRPRRPLIAPGTRHVRSCRALAPLPARHPGGPPRDGARVDRRQRGDRHHRRRRAADRLGPRLPDLAPLHRGLLRRHRRDGHQRRHRVRQPDAHVRRRRGRGTGARVRAAPTVAPTPHRAARDRGSGGHPGAGDSGRNHRAHRPQPMGGRLPLPRVDAGHRRRVRAVARRGRRPPAGPGDSR
jgi:hypothetical protein